MTTVYLGLDPSRYPKPVIHFPLIRIVPLSFEISRWHQFTHVIFTSRVTGELWKYPLDGKVVIAVGRATAATLAKVDYIAKEETAEGIVALLDGLDLAKAHFFLPRSVRSRSVIPDYLDARGVAYTLCNLYDTLFQRPGPLPECDELVFTSPSTVEAFIHFFGAIPTGKKLTCIGPVTRKALEKFVAIS